MSPTRRNKRRKSSEEETTVDEEATTVSFNWRFKQPSSEQIMKALASGGKKCSQGKWNNKQFETLLAYFDDLPKPKTSSDWLVQFNEQGQTCAQFLRTCPVARGYLGTRKFIYFVQIGDFHETMLDFESLYDYGRCFFNPNAIKKITPKIDVDLNDDGDIIAVYQERRAKLKYRRHASSRRVQLLAQSLHKFLASIKPCDALCVVGFCEYDLYAEDSDLFVAGLCDGSLGVGAFSCFRYDPRLRFCDENWYDSRIIRRTNRPTGDDFASILLVRSCKLLVHETCHLLGMEHCIYLNCCMNGSGHLEEDFEQSMFLCPIDLKKLALIVEFDLIGRYKEMKRFFDKHNAVKESEWLTNVIDALERSPSTPPPPRLTPSNSHLLATSNTRSSSSPALTTL